MRSPNPNPDAKGDSRSGDSGTQPPGSGLHCIRRAVHVEKRTKEGKSHGAPDRHEHVLEQLDELLALLRADLAARDAIRVDKEPALAATERGTGPCFRWYRDSGGAAGRGCSAARRVVPVTGRPVPFIHAAAAAHHVPCVPLEPPDGPPVVRDSVDEIVDVRERPGLRVRAGIVHELVVDSRELQRGARVDVPLGDRVPDRLRRVVYLDEPPRLLVAPSDERAGVSRVDAKRIHEPDQDSRLLDRVQVLAVEVLLGVREEPLLRIGKRLVNEARHLREPGQLRCPPTAFTGDDSVVAGRGLVRTHDDRLADTGALEAHRQRLQAGWVELPPSLFARRGQDPVDADAD